MRSRIPISPIAVAAFCEKNQIRRFSVFGSVLRQDFGPESDVDVLVEFAPEARVGYIRLAGMERELSGILGRRGGHAHGRRPEALVPRRDPPVRGAAV